jgi:hypothetical protein
MGNFVLDFQDFLSKQNYFIDIGEIRSYANSTIFPFRNH